jgi:endonuclease/exonuclease/phosphatase family metal-dependent hydrolase
MSGQGVIRIITFNIRYDNPDDGRDAWRFRKESVVHVLRSLNPSVFGLQEALAHQVDDIAFGLSDFAWIGVGRNDGHRDGEFNPIFWKRSEYTCNASGTFWLSDNCDWAGSKMEGAALPRVCTWVRLEPVSGGKPFFVFNTHFDHINEDVRERQAGIIIHKVSEIAGMSLVFEWLFCR